MLFYKLIYILICVGFAGRAAWFGSSVVAVLVYSGWCRFGSIGSEGGVSVGGVPWRWQWRDMECWGESIYIYIYIYFRSTFGAKGIIYMLQVVSPQPSGGKSVRKRRSGCDLPQSVAHACFTSCVLLSEARPKDLWKCVQKRQWQAVDGSSRIIAALLRATGGLIPHQSSLLDSFRAWLADKELSWCESDCERCCYDLRRSVTKLNSIQILINIMSVLLLFVP